ncbi:MAG: hypothetical protein KF753_00960 [Caldilineaceae bacterium]|nr:hypothetical protein [Caldilineaceae bacterium]
MAEEQKSGGNEKSQGGKSKNRRYFRRRRKGSGGGKEGQGAKEQDKSQPAAQSQSERPAEAKSEGQEKRRKRRRSNNSNKRRSSSSRRQRRQEQTEKLPPVAPEPEHYVEPVDVFVHTHIVRPAYRDAGSDYVSEATFLSGRRPPEASVHIERLQEELRGHLDKWFDQPAGPVKVTRTAGDEDWDDEEEISEEDRT